MFSFKFQLRGLTHSVIIPNLERICLIFVCISEALLSFVTYSSYICSGGIQIKLVGWTYTFWGGIEDHIYIYTVLVSICIQTKVQSDQQCRHVRFRWCGIDPDLYREVKIPLCHPRGFCKGSPAMAPALRKSLGTGKTHCHALLEDWEGNSQDNKFQIKLLFQTPFLEFHTEIWGFTFKASHPH